MNSSEIDFVVEHLLEKKCPWDNIPMVEARPFISPCGYKRDRYKCPHCNCKVDFVGDEIKTDSVARTLIYLDKLVYPDFPE
jgi:hypothetical protein